MSESLLPNWTSENSRSLGKEAFVATHRLNEHDIFSDESLEEIIESYPEPDMGINTMDKALGKIDWQEGSRGDCSASEILEAVRVGRLWLNLRKVMARNSQINQLVHRLYDELEQKCPGFHAFNRSANLLISSPQAHVNYHVDAPLNMLWHIRGVKRVWAYPAHEPFLSNDQLDGVLSGDTSEDISYIDDYDKSAFVHDLQPGEMITWAQNAPHRVVNLEGINVSLSTEHLTTAARRRINVYLANKFLREKFGWNLQSRNTTGPIGWAKENAFRILRRIPGWKKDLSVGFEYPTTFKINPSAPLGFEPINDAQASQHESNEVRELAEV